jgi:hypothetical protein
MRAPSDKDAELAAARQAAHDAEEDVEHRVNGQQAPAFTEEALALEFAERHAGELRYVASNGEMATVGRIMLAA